MTANQMSDTFTFSLLLGHKDNTLHPEKNCRLVGCTKQTCRKTQCTKSAPFWALSHTRDKLFYQVKNYFYQVKNIDKKYLIKNITEDTLKIVGGDLPVSQRDN